MHLATDLFIGVLATAGAFVAPQVATVLVLLFIYLRVSEIARRPRA
jgi:hypothetical protein